MSRNVITLPAYGWRPRKDQMPVWREIEKGTRFIALAAHRRYGKDELALQATATKAMERVGTYLYGLPEYNQLRKALWEGINSRTGRTRVADAFPPEIIEHKDNERMTLKLKNNSVIQFVGSDNYNSLVGGGPVGFVNSEAALANPAAWSFFRPMLLETKGWSLHISTPRGKNHFYNMVQNAGNRPDSVGFQFSAMDTEVFTLQQLDQERADFVSEHGDIIGNALFEQEYMCSFDAATIGAVWSPEIAELKQTGRFDSMPYDPRYPVDTSWDLGVGDDTVILFWQSIGGQERLIDTYVANNSGLDHYAQKLQEKKYYYGKHYAPHDIAVREWGSGISRIEQARALGIRFERVPQTDKQNQLALGAQLMRRAGINKDLCTNAMEALSMYRFKFDETRKIMSSTPIHDWTSHTADAFMTYAIAKARGQAIATPMAKEVETYQNVRLSSILNKQRSRGAWG